MNKITLEQIKELAITFQLDWKLLKAFIQVEGGGSGFDPNTGKIKIQFEPHYFLRHTKVKINNNVDVQSKEWEAFNEAFKINPTAAMMSTSIGIMQVMGENFKKCGYNSVNEMYDDFKKGEYEQIKGACNFIKNTPPLYKAMKAKDFSGIAYYYNGKLYYKNQYDVKIKQVYDSL